MDKVQVYWVRPLVGVDVHVTSAHLPTPSDPDSPMHYQSFEVTHAALNALLAEQEQANTRIEAVFSIAGALLALLVGMSAGQVLLVLLVNRLGLAFIAELRQRRMLAVLNALVDKQPVTG